MEHLGIPEGGLSPNSSFFVLLVPFFFFLISDFSRGYVVVQAYECLGMGLILLTLNLRLFSTMVSWGPVAYLRELEGVKT